MAHTHELPKSVLIVGVMYSQESDLRSILPVLTEKFGIVEHEITYDFSFTDYYVPEMGPNLKKTILAFKTPIDRDTLAQIKHWTNDLEDNYAVDSKRIINIDPGYLTLSNVVLASAKERPHKVSIGQGMFGDVVLEFESGTYVHSAHTFPDYKTPLVQAFLTSVRQSKKAMIHNLV